MVNNEKNTADTDYSLSAVPENAKKGFLNLFVVMLGFTFFSASMTTGGNLGLGLSLKDYVLAVIMGSVILGVYTSLLAYVSSKTGLTIDLMARHAFGNKGSYLPSAIISFTQTGWFGVGVAMFAVPVAGLIGVNPYVLIGISGIAMTLTAYFGMKGLEIIGTISVPLIAILGVMSMTKGINEVGGILNVFQDVPVNPITFTTALTLVVGSFVSGGTATPNFTRFAKTPQIAVATTAIAFTIGNILMFCFGAVKMGADVVGAIPHFEFTREYGVESLNYCMQLAEKYDRLVDVHCDEIDDGESKGLETLACRALESGLKDRVTASHTTAMHSYNNAYASKLFRLLKMSDVNFVCNPLVNTHLQGRFDTYPKRRGVTRVKELLANGNNVSMGHDDIFDPWYPLGDGNMRDVVHMGLHVCQMMGYDEIMNSYNFITHNAAKTLNLGDSYGIKVGNPASFLVLDADNFYNALNEKSSILLNYNKGRLIAKAQPEKKEILF